MDKLSCLFDMSLFGEIGIVLVILLLCVYRYKRLSIKKINKSFFVYIGGFIAAIFIFATSLFVRKNSQKTTLASDDKIKKLKNEIKTIDGSINVGKRSLDAVKQEIDGIYIDTNVDVESDTSEGSDSECVKKVEDLDEADAMVTRIIGFYNDSAK